LGAPRLSLLRASSEGRFVLTTGPRFCFCGRDNAVGQGFANSRFIMRRLEVARAI
jgi:hypothetical protein